MRMFIECESIYLHRDYVDFRKSINGLVTIVEQSMLLSPFSGALFVFCNKQRSRLKILYWDKTGFALWYKRLDKHKFKWPALIDEEVYNLTQHQLDWLLSGYDVLGHSELHYQSVAL